MRLIHKASLATPDMYIIVLWCDFLSGMKRKIPNGTA